MNFLSFYHRVLTTHPIITKSITALILTGAGDFCAQKFFPNKGQKQFDWHRHGRMLCVGLGYAVITHHWLNLLPRIFPGEGTKILLKRVFVDQIAYTPLMDILLYFSLSFMENPHAPQPEAGIKKTKECLPPTLKANYMLWPLLQYINFKFVPQAYQVLYINIFVFFWNIFLSTLANRNVIKRH